MAKDLEQIITICKALVGDLSSTDAPKSRERSLVITKLEEARMWAEEATNKEPLGIEPGPYYVTDGHGNKLRHG